MTRLLIADDHPLYRLALTQAVRGVLPEAEINEAEDMPAALAALNKRPDTDLVLLDLHMPGSHGLMGLASLRAEHPGVAVVMISAHDDPTTIRRALSYGATGYLTKRADLNALQAGLRAVLNCEEWLPPDFAMPSAPPAPSALGPRNRRQTVGAEPAAIQGADAASPTAG